MMLLKGLNPGSDQFRLRLAFNCVFEDLSFGCTASRREAEGRNSHTNKSSFNQVVSSSHHLDLQLQYL